MDSFETTVVDTETIVDNNIKSSLISICEDLEERGYNPIKQIIKEIKIRVTSAFRYSPSDFANSFI